MDAYSGDAVIVTDDTLHVTFMNEVAQNLTGWKNSSAIGRPLSDVCRGLDVDQVGNRDVVLQSVLRNGVVGILSPRFIYTASQENPIEILGKIEPIQVDHRVTGVVILFRESYRPKSSETVPEKELYEIRSRLESVLAAGEVGTWDLDVKLNRVRGDKNLGQLFGFTADEAANEPLESFINRIHVHDRVRIHQLIHASMQDRDVHNYEAEFRIVPEQGRIIWVAARGRIERDFSGEAIRFPGVLIDITVRKQNEEVVALLAQKSEQLRRLYATALSNTEDLIFTVDPQGHFTFVNSSLLNVWRMSYEQAIGKNFLEVGYAQEFAGKMQREIEGVIRTRATTRGETNQLTHSWNRFFEYILVPVIGEDGTVEAVAGSTREITDRKNDEMALRESQRNKDGFLATLAHELRNPLTPISIAISMMHDAAEDPAQVRELASVAGRQLKLLIRLVDDLLDVSRISLGKIELQLRQCLLQDVMVQALESVQLTVQESDHLLIPNIQTEPISLWGDSDRLTQVVMNLINNAVKYTNPGGRIEVTAKAVGKNAVIEVKDNGVGIPVDHLSGVFELYKQLDSQTLSKNSGLGLGLALVRQLVELHRGNVVIYSQGAGTGTRVTVEIPAIQNQAQETGATQLQERVTFRTENSRRILVVDDMRAITLSMKKLLERLGHRVLAAENCQAALDQLDSFQPEIIISDISMPGMSGYELAKQVRQRFGASIGLIAMTGYGMEADQEFSKKNGFDYHIVKPPNIRELQRVLETINSRAEVKPE
ncbi:ATP-binding protein [Planctomicrobium sp. SH668]|uniref:PAS domain-containing hybrid sensor histidine kinase/response regulator n=1 Tax=Planctomicrobium sp. SH668 TaxID=3448126 RepID=UPI003F5C9F7D